MLAPGGLSVHVRYGTRPAGWPGLGSQPSRALYTPPHLHPLQALHKLLIDGVPPPADERAGEARGRQVGHDPGGRHQRAAAHKHLGREGEGGGKEGGRRSRGGQGSASALDPSCPSPAAHLLVRVHLGRPQQLQQARGKRRSSGRLRAETGGGSGGSVGHGATLEDSSQPAPTALPQVHASPTPRTWSTHSMKAPSVTSSRPSSSASRPKRSTPCRGASHDRSSAPAQRSATGEKRLRNVRGADCPGRPPDCAAADCSCSLRSVAGRDTLVPASRSPGATTAPPAAAGSGSAAGVAAPPPLPPPLLPCTSRGAPPAPPGAGSSRGARRGSASSRAAAVRVSKISSRW
jgi:hypothetical protein